VPQNVYALLFVLSMTTMMPKNMSDPTGFYWRS